MACAKPREDDIDPSCVGGGGGEGSSRSPYPCLQVSSDDATARPAVTMLENRVTQQYCQVATTFHLDLNLHKFAHLHELYYMIRERYSSGLE